MKRQRRAQAWQDLANWYNQTYIQPYQNQRICNITPNGFTVFGTTYSTWCW